jgi:hypothetical protein
VPKKPPRGRRQSPKPPAGGRPASTRRPATPSADVDRWLDELDAAFLAADRARMEQCLQPLWKARRQVPEVLTQRLLDDRAEIPAFAFHLLQSFAGARARTYLRRVADERKLPDIVRFGAQRRGGWPERGEAKRRLAFLATLNDAATTLVQATTEAVSRWPPGGEILEEVVAYLAVMAPSARRAALEELVAELGDAAAWLLHAALQIPDPASQRLVLGELVRLRDPAAAGPVARLARTARDPALRDEATAALQRLQLRVVDEAAPREPLAFPPVDRALMSIVDGAGAQVLILVHDLGEAGYALADFLLKEGTGIKDTFGFSHVAPDEAEDVFANFVADAVDVVEVDLAAVRGALAVAVEVNAATGQAILPKFELWEPLVHASYPPPADEAVTRPELDDTPYARRADLLRASGRLAEHPYFETWTFDPAATATAMTYAPPPAAGRLTDRQYQPMLEVLLTPPVRAQLRERLRRQAWLLERVGEPRPRDLALAVAAALAGAPPADLARVPFLRKMLDTSILRFASELLLL